MKKDIKHIFWMLLCLFTIVACSDENHEMLITGPEIPELDHEPSIEGNETDSHLGSFSIVKS